MNIEPIPENPEKTKQIVEMNRHIERMIELKAPEVVIQCAANDRHAIAEKEAWSTELLRRERFITKHEVPKTWKLW